MGKIFFTSDLHFFHKNIIELSHRSFRDLEEMHEQIIKNWNRAVTPNDHVYLLGDVSFGSQEKTRNLLDRLNGKIYLIRGNHDNDILKDLCASRFEWIKDYYYLKVQDPDGRDGKIQPIVLCHFPFASWNRMGHGSWNLHGHCHGNLPVDKNLKRHDVGVDNNFMRPISYEEVKEIMKTRTFKPVDHHKEV